MGTLPERVLTDKLGRRSGPRRKYSVAEKRSMVEETRQPGASVPEVAQRHGVNANLLSVWRRLERQGMLIEDGRSKGPALLPVRVTTPTLLPTRLACVMYRKRFLSPANTPATSLDSCAVSFDMASGGLLKSYFR